MGRSLLLLVLLLVHVTADDGSCAAGSDDERRYQRGVQAFEAALNDHRESRDSEACQAAVRKLNGEAPCTVDGLSLLDHMMNTLALCKDLPCTGLEACEETAGCISRMRNGKQTCISQFNDGKCNYPAWNIPGTENTNSSGAYSPKFASCGNVFAMFETQQCTVKCTEQKDDENAPTETWECVGDDFDVPWKLVSEPLDCDAGETDDGSCAAGSDDERRYQRGVQAFEAALNDHRESRDSAACQAAVRKLNGEAPCTVDGLRLLDHMMNTLALCKDLPCTGLEACEETKGCISRMRNEKQTCISQFNDGQCNYPGWNIPGTENSNSDEYSPKTADCMAFAIFETQTCTVRCTNTDAETGPTETWECLGDQFDTNWKLVGEALDCPEEAPVDRLCETDSVVADMKLKGKASKAKTMSLCDCEDLCRAEDGGWGVSFKLNERKPKKSKCFCHTKRPKKVKSKKGKGYQYINFDE